MSRCQVRVVRGLTRLRARLSLGGASSARRRFRDRSRGLLDRSRDYYQPCHQGRSGSPRHRSSHPADRVLRAVRNRKRESSRRRLDRETSVMIASIGLSGAGPSLVPH